MTMTMSTTMMTTVLVLLVAFFAPVRAQLVDGCANIMNAGFEDHVITDPKLMFQYVNALYGWSDLTGRQIILRQGNIAWGGTHSGFGNFYLALQRAGSGISQTITVEANTDYTLTFWSAERIHGGAGNIEKLAVLIDDTSIVRITPPSKFTATSVQFTSSDTGKAKVTILNDSPGGDLSVFVDQIMICKTPPETSTTTTQTSTTHVTYTTHTIDQQVAKANIAIVSLENELMKEINDLKRDVTNLGIRLATSESKITDIPQAISDATAIVNARVTDVIDEIANSVSALPTPKVPRDVSSSCVEGTCNPSVESSGSDLSLNAPSGDIRITTDACGVVDLCGISRALYALKQVEV